MPIDIHDTTTATGPTLTDLVIEDLTAEGAELRARVADLEGDAFTYRDLLQAALAALADQTKTHERMRTNYHQLLDERRRERTPAPRAT